jgi:hypothetical protein
MGVYIKGQFYALVAEHLRHDLDRYKCRKSERRKRVAKIVEPNDRHAGSAHGSLHLFRQNAKIADREKAIVAADAGRENVLFEGSDCFR